MSRRWLDSFIPAHSLESAQPGCTRAQGNIKAAAARRRRARPPPELRPHHARERQSGSGDRRSAGHRQSRCRGATAQRRQGKSGARPRKLVCSPGDSPLSPRTPSPRAKTQGPPGKTGRLRPKCPPCHFQKLLRLMLLSRSQK